MNLHDELGQHGADASVGSRGRLESLEVRDSLDARVRRGRRRRLVGGGLSAVAGVSLVAVGVWAVVPGLGGDGKGDLHSAATIDEDLATSGTVYDIDSSSPLDPGIPIDLRLPHKYSCGDPFQVVEGVTVHDAAVLENGVVVASRSQVATLEDPTDQWLSGLDDAEMQEAWDNLTEDNPYAVDSEHEQHVFVTQEVSQEGAGIISTTVPLLLRDGVIASIGAAQGSAGDGPVGDAAPWPAWTPAPGTCETGADPGGYFDGTYEPVLVTQIWTTNLRQPLATVVFSAGEIEYTGLNELPHESIGGFEGLHDAHHSQVLAVRDWTHDMQCEAMLADADYATAPDPAADTVSSVPVPPTLETGRLYGWGDDALIGGYPIPVSGQGSHEQYLSLFPQIGDSFLVLRDGDQRWVFNVVWSERDDLPYDEPGWFISLSQVWDCGSPEVIGAGTYSASLVIPHEEVGAIYDLADVTVVHGVPSLPELHDQG